jgi:HEAT repeat protein
LVRDERETIRIRREAAEALGDSPDREALPAMQTLYRAVTPREVKQELIEAIGDSTFEATAISFMMDIAENEPLRELRHEAIEQLSDMPAERAVPALVQLYDKARDEETKEEILEGLGDANVEPAWRKLAAVAQREPSLKLRKLAIELLGESEDPDAVKFLEQLIR